MSWWYSSKLKLTLMLARNRAMHLWVEPSVIDAIAVIPGNVRQRVQRAIRDLSHDPRPTQSRALTIPDDLRVDGVEARCLRIDHWRVIYVVDQDLDLISALAARCPATLYL